MSLIPAIRDVCAAVSGDNQSASEVAAAIGSIIEDPGGSLGVVVQPSEPGFEHAMVSRVYETDKTSHITLTLAPGADLSVAELEDAFGPGGTPPVSPSGGSSMVFEFDEPGLPLTCAVIARFDRDTPEPETAIIREVVIRPDERWD